MRGESLCLADLRFSFLVHASNSIDATVALRVRNNHGRDAHPHVPWPAFTLPGYARIFRGAARGIVSSRAALW